MWHIKDHFPQANPFYTAEHLLSNNSINEKAAYFLILEKLGGKKAKIKLKKGFTLEVSVIAQIWLLIHIKLQQFYIHVYNPFLKV